MERGIGSVLAFILILVLGLLLARSIQSKAKVIFPGKYSVESKLQTTTRRYSYNSTDRLEDHYEPCDFNCSWETYVSNSEFQAKVAFRSPFSIEDDQKVTALRKQLACVPFSFGYSQEKGSKVFPPYTYPPCSSFPSEPRPTLHLANSTLSLTCPANTTAGKYVLHPTRVGLTDMYFYPDFIRQWQVLPYPNASVTDVYGDFALAGCLRAFTQAQLTPSLQSESYERAKNVTRKKAVGRAVRPVTVLFVTVDSFSRRHFYRKMSDTVKVMNEMNAGKKFTVFDFKTHNIIGGNSPTNMVPMFGNQTVKFNKRPLHEDILGPNSLWAIAKEWGFVTMLGFEYCGSNFINYIGKRLNVDHLVSTFYCAAKAYMKVENGMKNKDQRCIGPHMSHYYLLNYTHAFSSMYRGLNQFMYFHLATAHEETGQHAQTLDTDLALFLKRYTEDFGKDSDIAIIIQGDHGLGFGDWNSGLEADQEHKLPAMFLVASTELLERIPNSFDALWHNTFRLVSKRDFRATVLSLFGEPYGGTYPVHEEQYLQDAFILTREKVTDSRECNDTHIEPWYCSCLENTEEIQPDLYHTFGLSPLETLLTAVVSSALQIVNEEVFAYPGFPPGFICKKLTFESITRAFAYRISKKIEQFKVEFTINELSTARIEATAIVGVSDYHQLFARDIDSHPIDPLTYLGYPVNLRVRASQVVSVTRRDKYSSPCETFSRANGLNGEFCVCDDLEMMQQQYPTVFYQRLEGDNNW